MEYYLVLYTYLNELSEEKRCGQKVLKASLLITRCCALSSLDLIVWESCFSLKKSASVRHSIISLSRYFISFSI
jgi:hypothetical protein